MARRQRIQNRRRAHSSWPSIAMPAAEFSLVTEWDISSRRSSASVKAAYSLQYSSTFIMERNTQETIHDHITSISDLWKILTLWWAVTLSFKTWPTKLLKALANMEWNTQHREVQNNDESHKQYHWQRQQNTGGSVMVQLPGKKRVKRWHLQRWDPQTDRHSRDDQTGKDMEG